MRQFLMYGIVGTGGTVCHYVVLLFLVEFLNINPVIASSLGFVVGALVNHELNRKFVFPGTLRERYDTWGRFFAVACVGFFVNFGTMLVLTEGLSVYYLVAQVVATLIAFSATFALNKVWTFQA